MRFSILMIVTIIVSIAAGLVILSAFTQLTSKVKGAVDQAFVQMQYGKAYENQQALNIFNNVAKAYEDCMAGEDCLCDIYQLPFTGKHSINLKEESGKLNIILADNDGETIRVKELGKITTGVLKTGTYSCQPIKSLSLKSDIDGFFAEAQNEKYYFFPSIQEVYKPTKEEACFVTKRLAVYTNLTETQIKSHFSQLPPCTFKDTKLKERAIQIFEEFTKQFSDCQKSLAAGDCVCRLSFTALPQNYYIKIFSTQDKLKMQLVKSKGPNLIPQNYSIMEKDLEPASAFYLDKFTNALDELKESCLSITNESLDIFDYCELDRPVINYLLNASKIYFFTEGKSFAFVNTSLFLTQDKKSKINLINTQICPVPAGENYSHVWAGERTGRDLIISTCFGTTEKKQCNKGLGIKQEEGSKVFSIEAGILTRLDDAERLIILEDERFRMEYYNVLPSYSLTLGGKLPKGQQIGLFAPKRGEENPELIIAVAQKTGLPMPDTEKICFGQENKPKAVVVREGINDYVNPLCFLSKNILDKVAFPPECSINNKDCSYYGNKEEFLEDINLRILALPVNWDKNTPYFEFANKALEAFLKASPLNKCPKRFRKLFADGATNYGPNWTEAACHIPTTKANCYKDALRYIKFCADEYKAVTGQDYDLVVGIEDSDIASQPRCNYNERGWTAHGSRAIIVEQRYISDAVHELGHKFGLKDQYCDCSETEFSAICGLSADPNPLKENLGCSVENCCSAQAEEGYPYVKGCRWCKGNYDMNAEDTEKDGILDKGSRTSMSNYKSLNAFTIDEYNYLASQPQLQCL